MIKASISASGRYEALHPRFGAAFAFLRRPDLASLAPGRYDLAGEECFAMISEPELSPLAEEMTYEVHRRYLDIQSPLAATELFGVAPAPAAVPGFDEAKDCALFPYRGDAVTVRPGEFIVFHPEDAHAPCHTAGAVVRQKKVVIKVAV